jgi:hypothetical protein
MYTVTAEKQFVINSIKLPKDILNEIKDYLFYDFLSSKYRNQKRGLINQFKFGLWYFVDYYGHWGLSYRYERHLHAINCVCCGQYKMCLNGEVPPPKMECNCDEEYVEEIMEQVCAKP